MKILTAQEEEVARQRFLRRRQRRQFWRQCSLPLFLALYLVFGFFYGCSFVNRRGSEKSDADRGVMVIFITAAWPVALVLEGVWTTVEFVGKWSRPTPSAE